jgi:hypothetical protein
MAEKRKLFEEVGTAAAPVVPQGGLIDGRKGARAGIRLWLVAIFLLVAAMIAVGGLTRLTDSGLSITEWKPVTGAIPPLSEADWAVEFDKYKASPEFQLQNSQMALEEFKTIFWWEWGHRQLGRVVGLVWALGFVGFLVRARHSGRLDRTAFGPWRAGGAARRHRLVDGILGACGRAGGCQILPAGHSSGAGLHHPWLDGVVCVPAGPIRD